MNKNMIEPKTNIPKKKIDGQAFFICCLLYLGAGLSLWSGIKFILPKNSLIIAYAAVSIYSVSAIFAWGYFEWQSKSILQRFWCIRHGGHYFEQMRVGSDIVGQVTIDGYEKCRCCDKIKKINTDPQ